MYLPVESKISKKSGFSTQSSDTTIYYYTGYAGEEYRDEVLRVQSISGYRDVKTGTSLINFINTNINDIGSIIFAPLSPIYGTTYSLINIFSGLQTDYQPYAGDAWQAKLYETKYRCYTSIYWNYLGITGWWFRALSEEGNVQFKHWLYIYDQNFESETYGPYKSYILPNYTSTDQKAYELRNYNPDYHYAEAVEKWSINSYTSFLSNIQ